MRHFLLVYDIAHSRLDRVEDFGEDVQRATRAYEASEREYRDGHRGRFEVVLVGSDSLETVKTTHSRYFEARDLVPFA